MDVSLFFCALLAVRDMRLFLVATRLGRLQTTRVHLFLLNDESRLCSTLSILYRLSSFLALKQRESNKKAPFPRRRKGARSILGRGGRALITRSSS